MRSFLIGFLCIAISVSSAAESAFELNVGLIENFSKAQAEIAQASKKYSDFSDSEINLKSIMLNNGKEIVEQVRAAGAYTDFNDICKRHGFDSISQYVEVMSRVIGARTAFEFKQQGEAQAAQVENLDLDAIREQMTAQGLPKEMIDTQLVQMKEVQDMYSVVKSLAENVPASDLAFVSKNQQLIDQVLNR